MRVLLACYQIPGHLNPNLALAHALREKGHSVGVYTGSVAREVVEKGGFTFFQFDPAVDRLLSNTLLPSDGTSAASSLAIDKGWTFRVRKLNETLKEWLLESIPQQVSDLERIIEQFKPQVLVTDVGLLGPTLVLRERTDLPVAVFSVLAGCSIPGPDAPPWGRGLPSPRNFRTRFRSWLEKKIIFRITSDFRSRANQIRKLYGLPSINGVIAEEYARVPLFMVASTPSFDYYRKDLPDCVKYVGACSWEVARSDDVPEWLENLDSSLPVIHVTEGTIHTREPLVLRTAAKGLAGLPLQVIMTTGHHRKPADLNLGYLAANIRVEQFVPHSYLFPRTDVLITTGGAGTVTKALLCGVPAIVIPTAWELPENAQRVVESGAGLRIEPQKCTPRQLRQAVKRILQDPSFGENARRIGRDMEKQGGPQRAVELLEQLATSSRQNIPTEE